MRADAPLSGDESGTVSRTRLIVAEVVVAALLGAVWAGRRLRATYFYYDDWSIIGRVTYFDPIKGATTSYSGHLAMFVDVFYRLQAFVFGLESNRFLVVVFLVSLVAVHLSLTAVAVQIGVPLTTSLILGGFLTYLGPAAQNFIFVVQFSSMFALASALGATAVALHGHGTRDHRIAVTVLLLASPLFDSAVGILALALGGGAVIGLWPRRYLWTLVPSLGVMAGWYLFGDLGPKFEASIRDRVVFAGRLGARGAGALVGGGAWAGVVVFVVFVSAAVVAVASCRLDRAGKTVMLAAGAATVINVAGIAQSRAGLPGFTFFENNRYLQNVAIPLTITFLPALVACSKLATKRWPGGWFATGPARLAVPALLVGVCFVLGLDEERDYADVFIERTEQVRSGVSDIGIIENAGCPSGQNPDLDVRALGPLSPQVSARLVGDLVDRESLTIKPRSIESVDPEILRLMCQP